jgi:hypothetical protein
MDQMDLHLDFYDILGSEFYSHEFVKGLDSDYLLSNHLEFHHMLILTHSRHSHSLSWPITFIFFIFWHS